MQAHRKSMEPIHMSTSASPHWGNSLKQRLKDMRRMREANMSSQVKETSHSDIEYKPIIHMIKKLKHSEQDGYYSDVPTCTRHRVIRDLKDCVGIDLGKLYIDSYFDHGMRTRSVDSSSSCDIDDLRIRESIIRKTVEQRHTTMSNASYESVAISCTSQLTSEFDDLSSFNTVDSMVDTESQKSEINSISSSISMDSDLEILYGLCYSDIPDVDL